MTKAPTPVSEPISYFELQRRRDGIPEPGEARGDIPPPPLPTTSPWGSGPQPGDEPPVDRSDDADVMGVEIDQLNR
jgi:hypothetical protein